MSNNEYPIKDYLSTVYEDKVIEWEIYKKEGNIIPESGDLIILWYTKTSTDKPGIYGWGIILEYKKFEKKIRFCPIVPSDKVKNIPIFNNDIRIIINEIRMNYQGTMYIIPKEYWSFFHDLFYKWIKYN